jgi:hypothetical protein
VCHIAEGIRPPYFPLPRLIFLQNRPIGYKVIESWSGHSFYLQVVLPWRVPMANFAADKTKNIINYQLIAVGVIVEFQFVGIEM